MIRIRRWFGRLFKSSSDPYSDSEFKNDSLDTMGKLDEAPSASALIVRNVEYRAYGPPNRGLSFELEVDNRIDQPLVVLGDWTKCRFLTTTVAEGQMVKVYYSGGYAIVEEDGCRLDIRVPLSRETLEYVEDRREGESLDYELNVDLYVATAIKDDESSMGVPWTINLAESQHEYSIEGTIPQSRWLELLERTGWEETLLVEIPARRLRHRSPEAMNRYREALNHHRRGNWRKSLAACREVFEALAWRYTDDEATEPDMPKLRNYFPDNRKGDTINVTLKELGEFLHLGRHVQNMEEKIDIEKKDSVLALNITAGVLRYTSE